MEQIQLDELSGSIQQLNEPPVQGVACTTQLRIIDTVRSCLAKSTWIAALNGRKRGAECPYNRIIQMPSGSHQVLQEHTPHPPRLVIHRPLHGSTRFSSDLYEVQRLRCIQHEII